MEKERYFTLKQEAIKLETFTRVRNSFVSEVVKMDCAMQRMYHISVDSSVGFNSTSPIDNDLSSEQRCRVSEHTRSNIA